MSLQQDAKSALALNNIKISRIQLSVRFQTDAAANNTLVLALVQKNAVSVVKSGENRGRTLHHVQIVSQLSNIALTSSTGEAKLMLPADFAADNYELIAFVQQNRNGEIIAAARTAMPINLNAGN